MQITLIYPDKHVYYALKALKSDPRAQLQLKLKGNHVEIYLSAVDSIAARRMLNSILRITSTIERLKSFFE